MAWVRVAPTDDLPCWNLSKANPLRRDQGGTGQNATLWKYLRAVVLSLGIRRRRVPHPLLGHSARHTKLHAFK